MEIDIKRIAGRNEEEAEMKSLKEVGNTFINAIKIEGIPFNDIPQTIIASAFLILRDWFEIRYECSEEEAARHAATLMALSVEDILK